MRIALLAGRPYLSNKLYSSLVRQFPADEIIYLDDGRTNPEGRAAPGAAGKAVVPPFSCEYHDFSIPVRPVGEDRFYKKVLRWKRELALYSSFLDSLKLDAIVTYTDMSMTGRLLGEWAHSRKKPYIIIQAAFIDNPSLRKPISFEQRLRYFIFNRCLSIPKYRKQNYWGGEVSGAEILLWGEAYRLPYRGSRTINIIGNPSYDGLYHNAPGPRGEAVLLCTQPSHASAEIAASFRVIAGKNRDRRFMVKTHPRVHEDIWAEKLCDIENVRIIENGPIETLLPEATVQISINSVTTLEAILYGIPVICLVHPQRERSLISGNIDNNLGFFDGIAEYAIYNDPTDIAEKIDRIGTEKYYEEFLQRRHRFIAAKLSSLDGNASAKAADLIRRSIIRSRK